MLDRLRNSHFLKSVMHLMTGTILSQVINFLAAIILTRLFHTVDFGNYTIYLLVSNALAVFVAGRLEMAVMLPTKREDGIAIAGLAAIIAGIICLFCLLLAATINALGPHALLVEFGLSPTILYFSVVTAFLISITQIILYWLSREEKYKFISSNRVLQAIVTALASIGFGFAKTGWLGLVYANMMGLTAGLFGFWFVCRKDFTMSAFSRINKVFVLKTFKEYRNFPLYSAPLALINNISVNILGYAIQLNYGTHLLGIYSYANRIVNMPLNLISSSFSTVFYQKVAANSASGRSIYIKAFLINLLLGGVLLMPLVLFGDVIFAWLFGAEWRESGLVARYIALYLLSSFAVGSITSVFSAKRKDGIVLVWQLLFLLFACLLLSRKEFTFYQSLLVFSIYGFIMYFILFIIGIYIVTYKNEKSN